MHKRYWFILLVFALLSPLGLLASGTAWGEWDADGLKETLGYVPQGMEQLESFWQAIFPDYSMQFLGDGTIGQYTGYILSALIGSAIIYAVMLLIAKVLVTPKKQLHA